jgi:hypothetical protein
VSARAKNKDRGRESARVMVVFFISLAFFSFCFSNDFAAQAALIMPTRATKTLLYVTFL